MTWGADRENGWVDGLPSEGPECPVLKHSDLLRGVSDGAETFRRTALARVLSSGAVEWGNMHLPATRVPRARRRMSLAFGAVARCAAFGMVACAPRSVCLAS